MPGKRNAIKSQNTFIDTIIRKFDDQDRNYLIANATVSEPPIIYCNDGFCDVTGYQRSEILQRVATCDFLVGSLTSTYAHQQYCAALRADEERQIELVLYKKDGAKFYASVLVAPIRSETQTVILQLVSFDDITQPNQRWTSPRDRFRSLGLAFPTLSGALRRVSHAMFGARQSQTDNEFLPEESVALSRVPEVPANQSTGLHDDEPPEPGLAIRNRAFSLEKQPQRQTRHSDAQIHSLRPHDRASSKSEESPRKLTLLASLDSARKQVTQKLSQVLTMGQDSADSKTPQHPALPRCMVLHFSPLKAAWDWCILALVLYTAIVTPFAAAFLLQEQKKKKNMERFNDPLTIIDMVVDIIFIIDIILNFRTTYINKNDDVVTHAGKIAIRYFKGWFLIDAVAAIPFDLLLLGTDTDETTTLIGLLKTARLLRLVRLARTVDQYSEYGAAVLLLLMSTFSLIAHWLACIWYAIASVERDYLPEPKQGWVDVLANSTQQPYYINGTGGGPTLESKYITALYFTFSSLSSVGFGNIAPNTNSEKTFSIIIMLIGSLMYASIFGNVSAIIQNLYSGTARYHTEMGKVKEFIRFHQIPNPLRQRLEEYFQHAWKYTNGVDMNVVLKGFPECLQADICLHLNRNLLNNCPAFQTASPGCLRALGVKFHTTHVPPGDILVHRGDLLDNLYFISRGSVEILRDDIVMAILGKDDIFGENVCQHKYVGKSSCNVRALTYCDLHKVARHDLLDVLEMYPEFAGFFASKLRVTFDLRDRELTVHRPTSSSDTDSGGSEIPALRSRQKLRGISSVKRNLRPVKTGKMSHSIGGSDDDDPARPDVSQRVGGGIIEFTPEKAGRDVTPANLDFSKSKGLFCNWRRGKQPDEPTSKSPLIVRNMAASLPVTPAQRQETSRRHHGVSAKGTSSITLPPHSPFSSHVVDNQLKDLNGQMNRLEFHLGAELSHVISHLNTSATTTPTNRPPRWSQCSSGEESLSDLARNFGAPSDVTTPHLSRFTSIELTTPQFSRYASLDHQDC